MTPIELRLPRDSKAKVIFNSLYADGEMAHRTEDVVLIDLGNSVFIDVGWYPDRDPSGSYRINIYRERWEKQLRRPIRVKDPHKVASQIEKLATRFATRSRRPKAARQSST